MANMKKIGERLSKKMIYLKENPSVVSQITLNINSLKYKNTGEPLTIDDKKKILDEIETHLPLNELESSDKLRVILKSIKDKLDAK